MADRHGFVFPQTITDDPNFLRAGGLTKTELVATIIFTSIIGTAKLPYELARTLAIEQAEKLLDDIEDKKLRPVRRFQDS